MGVSYTNRRCEMVRNHIKKWIATASVALCFAVTLSSCGLINVGGNKSDDAEDIESVVSDFLESLADGSFAEDDYKSELTTDKSFSKLKFEEKDAEKLMALALEKIEFEIGKIKGNQDDGEGTCEVTVTTIDLKAILDDLGDEFDFGDVEDAIKDKKAPTEENEITFEMEHDGENWLISDMADLTNVAGKPFSKLVFKTAETTPETTPEMTTTVATPTPTIAPQVYTAQQIIAAVDSQGWCDPEFENYVNSYGPGDNQLTFMVYFKQNMPGMTLQCELFYNNGTTSYYTGEYTFTADDIFYYVYDTYEGGIPADTYRCVIYHPDGTVIADSSITVTE